MKAGSYMKHEDMAKRIQVTLKHACAEVWRQVPKPAWIIIGAILVYIALKLTAPSLTVMPPQERSWLVSAVPVVFQDVQPEKIVFGQVISGRQTELRALVAGRVVDTGANFREGGIVVKGELLLQIDPFDYQASLDDANAKLREGKARLKTEEDGLKINRQQFDLAIRDYKRAVHLHEKGTVSRKFLDNAELALSRSELEVSARKNRIEIEQARVQQLDVVVRRAKHALNDATLVAPFDGYVGNVNAEVGKRVSLNDRVAMVSDSDRLEVRFSITDAQYGRILASQEKVIGRSVAVVWRVGGEPLEYPAVVARVGAEIEATSGGVDLYAEIDRGAAGANLRPGAFVEIKFPDRRYEKVVQLHERVVFEGKRVYVIVNDRLVPRDIEVLGFSGDEVFIKGKIAVGEKILATRFAEVGEGVLVETRATK